MDSNTLSPKVAAVTITSTHAGNRNLSTDPKRIARVAQFSLGQMDIRDCVSFLINRENVI